ncbi:MAG TPA: hypothetical protein VMS56_01265 [Thermoanaerobaculia bacterium]|nr:hypothetical protein [Thermoanaerobaculia bacterium]
MQRNDDDLRTTRRYAFATPLQAVFGTTPIGVRNLGSYGLQAEHSDPIKLGSNARIVFDIPAAREKIAIRGRLVWSRLSKTPNERGKYLYLSGVQFDESAPFPPQALDTLVQLGLAVPDDDSLQRKRDELARRQQERSQVRVVQVPAEELPSDQALLVQHAIAQLRGNPDEAQKWYQRARFSPPVVDGKPLPYREDVVAIWEYLGRTIAIDVVARVLERDRAPE